MNVPSAPLSMMYQEQLLAEYRAPSNRRDMPDATARAERSNPVCGDALCLMVRVVDGQLADISFTGHGCSLATASASLLTQTAWRRGISDGMSMVAAVEAMLSGVDVLEALPAALSPLQGVTPFPGRHGCVMLPWLALRDALGPSASR
ncbi:MAG: SUF system NifU family Fe-S cluster assembly protein [Gemmatimonadaceae bacterium]|nr:SUF system NifU family Fe-S cluster assembly protein [Gemmatimonadaceae bacterium]